MDTLTSVDPTTAATAIGTTIQILILNNWSFVVATLVAVAASCSKQVFNWYLPSSLLELHSQF